MVRPRGVSDTRIPVYEIHTEMRLQTLQARPHMPSRYTLMQSGWTRAAVTRAMAAPVAKHGRALERPGPRSGPPLPPRDHSRCRCGSRRSRRRQARAADTAPHRRHMPARPRLCQSFRRRIIPRCFVCCSHSSMGGASWASRASFAAGPQACLPSAATSPRRSARGSRDVELPLRSKRRQSVGGPARCRPGIRLTGLCRGPCFPV